MSDEEKKVTGLRSAVRYGKLTKEQALQKLDELAKVSEYKSPELVEWLRRRVIPCAVGPYKPASQAVTMRYVGDNLPRLKGCTALVARSDHGVGLVVAQFDRRETGYGFGWHLFKVEDFENECLLVNYL